jgi:hypothetical protein
LAPTNASASNAAPTSQGAGAGGGGTVPCSVSTVAKAPATNAPPANIASARAALPLAAWRRNSTLLSAKLKPPSTPSHSASVCGQGQPPPSGRSTIAAPASASTMRSAASGVNRSCSSTRASSTAHSGIR